MRSEHRVWGALLLLVAIGACSSSSLPASTIKTCKTDYDCSNDEYCLFLVATSDDCSEAGKCAPQSLLQDQPPCGSFPQERCACGGGPGVAVFCDDHGNWYTQRPSTGVCPTH